MVAARVGRGFFNLGEETRYEDVINSIDWNRVLIQARAEHRRVHTPFTYTDTMTVCGECIQSVLLRKEEPLSEDRCVHYATAEVLFKVTVDEPNLNQKAIQCKDCVGERIYFMSRYGRLKVERCSTVGGSS